MHKYLLLRFLNKNHNFIMRTLFAATGFLGVFVVTHSLDLSVQTWRDFQGNNFKIAARRASRYLQIFWDITIVNDEIYNFTEGLPLSSLRILEKHLERLVNKTPDNTEKMSCQLYVWSAIFEINPETFMELSTRFCENASRICQLKNCLEDVSELEFVESKRSADFNKKHARLALADFTGLLPIEDWKWYVVSGTFLGLIREEGFLAHDYDLDFGIHAEGLDTEKLLEVLETSGKFHVCKVDSQKRYEISNGQLRLISNQLSMIKLIHKTHVNVDLFIHHLEGGKRWHGSSFHRWENMDFDLKSYEFEGQYVYGPNDAEIYLTENYGDWKTPVTDFNCSTGTPNLVIINNFSSISLFITRIAISSDPRIIKRNIMILRQAGFLKSDSKLLFTFAPFISKSKTDALGKV